MRIIAGEFRGRLLLGPEGLQTRPITDRAKQSLFDILAPDIPGARAYDCFAGTGSIGLECLSRGAEHVTFFESDRSAASRLRRNIETLGVNDRSLVVAQDLFGWFSSNRGSHRQADLIFLDPPYRFLRDRAADLQRLAEQMAKSHLSQDGMVIFRHDAADRLELPALGRYDQREYGGMTIEFLRRSAQRNG
jgi:16S rRNA (guanine(966)-N(2))-methyltransferase RsmD